MFWLRDMAGEKAIVIHICAASSSYIHLCASSCPCQFLCSHHFLWRGQGNKITCSNHLQLSNEFWYHCHLATEMETLGGGFSFESPTWSAARWSIFFSYQSVSSFRSSNAGFLACSSKHGLHSCKRTWFYQKQVSRPWKDLLLSWLVGKSKSIAITFHVGFCFLISTPGWFTAFIFQAILWICHEIGLHNIAARLHYGMYLTQPEPRQDSIYSYQVFGLMCWR